MSRLSAARLVVHLLAFSRWLNSSTAVHDMQYLMLSLGIQCSLSDNNIKNLFSCFVINLIHISLTFWDHSCCNLFTELSSLALDACILKTYSVLMYEVCKLSNNWLDLATLSILQISSVPVKIDDLSSLWVTTVNYYQVKQQQIWFVFWILLYPQNMFIISFEQHCVFKFGFKLGTEPLNPSLN